MSDSETGSNSHDDITGDESALPGTDTTQEPDDADVPSQHNPTSGFWMQDLPDGETTTPYEQIAPTHSDDAQKGPLFDDWSSEGTAGEVDDDLGGTVPPKRRLAASPAGTLLKVGVLTALIAASVGGGAVYFLTRNSGPTSPAAAVIKQVTGTSSSSNNAGGTSSSTLQSILSKVEPAVVDINTSGVSNSGSNFFGGSTSFQAAGTGMIITSSGIVLTNNHVITDASTITVTLDNSSKQYAAKVIGYDTNHDVALIQIENPPASLPTVTFGDSSKVAVGDNVVAIGNALALAGGPTVTEGIISALGRTITASNDNGGTETLTNMLQTDAPINPGNSGGPLVNTSGDVIGMNTAAFSGTGSNNSASTQNIGFSEPVNGVLTIVRQIEANPNGASSNNNTGGASNATHGYLGIAIQDLSAQSLTQFGYPTTTTGVLVVEVIPGGPAASAGMQSGDVITSIDGQAVTSLAQLSAAIDAKAPGATVNVSWIGPNTASQSATITLGSSI